jgi:hypothetical protein
LKLNNGGERSPKTWLAQGERRGIYRWENLAVGRSSRQSPGISATAPDFRPNCPAASPAVAKLLSNVVRRATGFFRPRAGAEFFRPGAELSDKKKHQHENGDNLCTLTLFLMNLGSLESTQQDLQLHP